MTDTKNMAQGKVSKYGKGYQVRGRYTDGTQFRKIGFATKAAANSHLDTVKAGEKDRSLVPPTEFTLYSWFDFWVAANQSTWKPTTYDGYLGDIERVKVHLKDVKLQDLTETHLRQMYKSAVEAGRATNTIKGMARRINTALTAAVQERKIPYNVQSNVKVPKGKAQKVMSTWSFEELNLFLKNVADERDAAMWLYWVTTGVRRGELCGLEWSKVDLEKGVARIDWQRTVTPRGRIVEGTNKTDAGERDVPIDPRVVSALRTWRSSQAQVRLAKGSKWTGGDKVFTTNHGKMYSPRSFRDRLDDLTERYGCRRLTPHELRHTFGTLAAEDGMEITLLSKIMGHSKVETTMNLYIHPGAEQARTEAGKLTARMLG